MVGVRVQLCASFAAAFGLLALLVYSDSSSGGQGEAVVAAQTSLFLHTAGIARLRRQLHVLDSAHNAWIDAGGNTRAPPLLDHAHAASNVGIDPPAGYSRDEWRSWDTAVQRKAAAVMHQLVTAVHARNEVQSQRSHWRHFSHWREMGAHDETRDYASVQHRASMVAASHPMQRAAGPPRVVPIHGHRDGHRGNLQSQINGLRSTTNEIEQHMDGLEHDMSQLTHAIGLMPRGQLKARMRSHHHDTESRNSRARIHRKVLSGTARRIKYWSRRNIGKAARLVGSGEKCNMVSGTCRVTKKQSSLADAFGPQPSHVLPGPKALGALLASQHGGHGVPVSALPSHSHAAIHNKAAEAALLKAKHMMKHPVSNAKKSPQASASDAAAAFRSPVLQTLHADPTKTASVHVRKALKHSSGKGLDSTGKRAAALLRQVWHHDADGSRAKAYARRLKDVLTHDQSALSASSYTQGRKSAATVRSSSRGSRSGKAVLAASASTGGGDVVAPAPVNQEEFAAAEPPHAAPGVMGSGDVDEPYDARDGAGLNRWVADRESPAPDMIWSAVGVLIMLVVSVGLVVVCVSKFSARPEPVVVKKKPKAVLGTMRMSGTGRRNLV